MMLALALAAIGASGAASTPAAQSVTARQQATASVRILRPATLRFAQIEQREPARLRTAVVRGPDGVVQAARLVEFE